MRVAVLGGHANATTTDINKAYRNALKRCHPDHHRAADAAFAATRLRQVQYANDVILQHRSTGTVGAAGELLTQATNDVIMMVAQRNRDGIGPGARFAATTAPSRIGTHLNISA